MVFTFPYLTLYEISTGKACGRTSQRAKETSSTINYYYYYSIRRCDWRELLIQHVKAPHVPPCEGGEMSAEQQQAVVDRYLERQAARNAARPVVTYSVAMRDDGYDTVY